MNITVQSEIIKNVVNLILKPSNIQVISLSELMQGDAFQKLVEILIDEKIDEKKLKPIKGNNRILINNYLDANFSTIMNHINPKYKEFKNIKRPTDEKDIISFMVNFLKVLYVKHSNNEIMNSVIFYLKEFETTLQIQNMTTQWKNGLPYIAILSKLSNGSIRYEDKGNASNNFQYIKESCEFIDIPLILTKDYFINNRQDININCFQVYIIFKSKNIDIFNEQKTYKEEQNKSIFNKKILEYSDSVDKALKCFECEDNKLNLEFDLKKFKIMINDFNTKLITECQKCYYTTRSLREQITNLSNQFKIIIPLDSIIDIDIVESKYKDLIKHYKSQEEINKFEEKIGQINSIKYAKEILNELETRCEIFDTGPLIFKVEEKINDFEKKMNELINECEVKLTHYNHIYDLIVVDIENRKSIDEINQEIKSLKEAFIDTENSYNKITDHTDQIVFPRDEMESKYKKTLNMMKEYEHKLLLEKIENEYNNIMSKCDYIYLEIKKFDEYQDIYDVNLCEIARKEHPIDIPEWIQYERLIKQIENDSEIKYPLNDTKNLIHNVYKKVSEAFEALKNREKESKEIEEISKLALDKAELYDDCIISDSFYSFEEVQNKIKDAESFKNWNENAKGQSIAIYNDNIMNAKKKLENIKKRIENKFNQDYDRIKNSIEQFKIKYICETTLADDEVRYIEGSKNISNLICEMKYINEINDKLFHTKNDINEILDKLNQLKNSLNDLSNKFTTRIHQFNIDLINAIINDQKTLEEEIISDNSNLGNLTVENLDKKGSNLIFKYKEIIENEKLLIDYSLRYDFGYQFIDSKNIMNLLHDFIIFYKSTLLLKPKSFSDNFQERIKNCIDPNFSYAMIVLLIYKFSNANSKYKFDGNISEIKSKIDIALHDQSFLSNVSKQIFDRIISLQSIESIIELDVLIDFVNYIPNFNEYLINYINSNVNCRNDILKIVKNITEKVQIPCKLELHELIKQCLEKYNDIETTNKKSHILSNNNNNNVNEMKVIIGDFGSYKSKVGFSTDKMPKYVFPTTISRLSKTDDYCDAKKDLYIGDEHITSSYCHFDHKCPIKNGIIQDFDTLEKIFDYAFETKLGCNLEKDNDRYNRCHCRDYKDCTIFLVEPPNISKANRERLIQTMIECYGAANYFTSCSSVLSAYSVGKTTGIVVDVGYEVSHIVPVYEGYNIENAKSCINLGGNDIESFLFDAIDHQETYLDDYSFLDKKAIIHKIKEKHCYVALDYETEKQNINPLMYLLRQVNNTKYEIPLLDERITCTEILFDPSLKHFSIDGIGKCLANSLSKCNSELHKDLCTDIILAGGSTLFNGFQERLKKETENIVPMDVNVIADPNREFAAWIGGSLIAYHDSFSQMIISHDEYNECGPGIIHRKCL